MFNIKLSNLEDNTEKYSQDLLKLKNAVLENREKMKQNYRIISESLFYKKQKLARANSKVANSIVGQFIVYDFDVCVNLDKHDIFEREKEIFERLDFKEKSRDIKRFDKYLGCDLTKAEVIDYLLHAKSEYNFDLDSCMLIVDAGNFKSLFPNAEDEKDFSIHGIQILTDYFYPIENQVLDSRLVIVPKQYEMTVYKDEFEVDYTLNRVKYDSYHSYLPEVKTTNSLSIKLKESNSIKTVWNNPTPEQIAARLNRKNNTEV